MTETSAGEPQLLLGDADLRLLLRPLPLHLLVSVLLALAPPPALREPLEEEEPSESEEELLMLSLS